MRNKKTYAVLGSALCLLAAVFIAIALSHPELCFPWPNWVSYTLYSLYAIFTAVVFLMPKFKGASLAVCGIAAVDFLALALIVIYIGTRGTAHENSLYLTAGLALSCIVNFANIATQKRKCKQGARTRNKADP